MSGMTEGAVAPLSTCSLFDAHCHLQLEPLLSNVIESVERAKSVGVLRASVCGTCPGEDWNAVASLASRFPDFVVPCLGLHPYWIYEYLTAPEQVERRELVEASACAVSEEANTSIGQWPTAPLRFDSKKYEDELEDALSNMDPASHVGECGLDKRLCDSKSISRSNIRSGLVVMDVQIEILKSHIRVARKLRRTLVLHCVGAWGALYEVLREEASNGLDFAIVLHSCNSLSIDMACTLSKLGHIYFSISGGHLTPKVAGLIKAIPIDRLLLESDAPDQSLASVDLGSMSMGPAAPLLREYESMPLAVPGKSVNEPYRLILLCYTLASYLSMCPIELGEVTRRNAERVFLGM